MTTIEDIRELLSDMQKYCDVIESCEASHNSKMKFAKLLITLTDVLHDKDEKLIGEVENEQ